MIERTCILSLIAAVALSGDAQAAEVTVKLTNSGADGIMAFDPGFVKIKPGDSVKFVAADQGHNVESIDGMAPDGAKPIKGEIGKDTTVVFDKEGIYGVKCMPHFMMGMTALIAVGDNYPNLAAAKSATTNPAAKKRLDADFAKLGK